jgi:hypothetical protein
VWQDARRKTRSETERPLARNSDRVDGIMAGLGRMTGGFEAQLRPLEPHARADEVSEMGELRPHEFSRGDALPARTGFYPGASDRLLDI